MAWIVINSLPPQAQNAPAREARLFPPRLQKAQPPPWLQQARVLSLSASEEATAHGWEGSTSVCNIYNYWNIFTYPSDMYTHSFNLFCSFSCTWEGGATNQSQGDGAAALMMRPHSSGSWRYGHHWVAQRAGQLVKENCNGLWNLPCWVLELIGIWHPFLLHNFPLLEWECFSHGCSTIVFYFLIDWLIDFSQSYFRSTNHVWFNRLTDRNSISEWIIPRFSLILDLNI